MPTAILAPLYPNRVAYACDEALESLGFRREVRSSKELMRFLKKANSVATSYGVTALDLTDALWIAAWTDEEVMQDIKDWLCFAVDFEGDDRGSFDGFNEYCRSKQGCTK